MQYYVSDETSTLTKVRQILSQLDQQKLGDGLERDKVRTKKICADDNLLYVYCGIPFMPKSKIISYNSGWPLEELIKLVTKDALSNLFDITFESESKNEYPFLLTRYDQLSRPNRAWLSIGESNKLENLKKQTIYDNINFYQERFGMSHSEMKNVIDRIHQMVKSIF